MECMVRWRFKEISNVLYKQKSGLIKTTMVKSIGYTDLSFVNIFWQTILQKIQNFNYFD